MAPTKKQVNVYKRLSSIYLNPKDPGSLGGVQRLFKRAKELGITSDREKVKEFVHFNFAIKELIVHSI